MSIEFVFFQDLFVPNHRLESATKEAETLQSIEMTFLDVQWLQVRIDIQIQLFC